MKIAGIAGGRNRGEIIELSEEKKIFAAVKVGIIKWAEEYKGGKYLAFVTSMDISSSSSSPHGDLLKRKWANNVYRAKGTLKLHLRNKVSDTLLEPKAKSFEIEFYDSLDSLGMPDVRVEKITIK